jgi:hypothetical protein
VQRKEASDGMEAIASCERLQDAGGPQGVLSMTDKGCPVRSCVNKVGGGNSWKGKFTWHKGCESVLFIANTS